MEQKKILVVEDEKPLREALVEKLSAAGHEVVSATNGDEGLTVALETKPDVILLDLLMPDKGGLPMLEELRQDPWGETARVIVLTNLSDPEHIANVLATGTHEYLVKTEWTLAELLDEVTKKLS